METQEEPRFRPRVLPMPKVGDIILSNLFPGKVFTVIKEKAIKCSFALFECVDEDYVHYGFEYERLIWCFADPAVEALRLQEAAWRADTSPFPDSFMRIISGMAYRKIEVSFDSLVNEAMETVGEMEYGCCVGKDYEDTRDTMIFFLPLIQRWLSIDRDEQAQILLRWQAQQEGGNNA